MKFGSVVLAAGKGTRYKGTKQDVIFHSFICPKFLTRFIKIFILNNKVLGKISETQHFNHDNRFAATAISGGYTVPKFEKIAEAYGIRATTLGSFDELDSYKEWIDDEFPCLFDISLPEESFLTPKIKFETGMINPKLDDSIFNKAKAILKGCQCFSNIL